MNDANNSNKRSTVQNEIPPHMLQAACFTVKPIKAARKKFNRKEYYLKRMQNFTLTLVIGGVFFCAFSALHPSGEQARVIASLACAIA